MLRDKPALLIDLDDTLYDYAPSEAAGRRAVVARLAAEHQVTDGDRRYEEARAAVKARLGRRACAHSRLLYLAEMAAALPDALRSLRAWEKTFWDAYLGAATLRPFAREMLTRFRGRGGKVAVVTDQVVAVQTAKLAHLGLFDCIDALAASEEVDEDKPRLEVFELALARIRMKKEDAIVVGDNPAKDGGGAAALGAPYFQAYSSETGEGMPLEEIARALGLIST